MSMFDIGDKVKVVKPTHLSTGDHQESAMEPPMCNSWVSDMDDMDGGVYKVIGLSDGAYTLEAGYPFEYEFLPEWLELVKKA